MVINKNSFVIFLLLGAIIFSLLPLTLADSEVCCEESNGNWCVDAPLDQCNPDYSYSSTVCDNTVNCLKGTCIYTSDGICTSGTSYLACIMEGGSWDGRNIDEIESCSKGCCVIGDSANLATLWECRDIYTDSGIDPTDGNFEWYA